MGAMGKLVCPCSIPFDHGSAALTHATREFGWNEALVPKQAYSSRLLRAAAPFGNSTEDPFRGHAIPAAGVSVGGCRFLALRVALKRRDRRIAGTGSDGRNFRPIERRTGQFLGVAGTSAPPETWNDIYLGAGAVGQGQSKRDRAGNLRSYGNGKAP